MSKCYIPEIPISTIRKDSNLNKIKNDFTFNLIDKKIICCNNGYYDIQEKNITKYTIIPRNNLIFEKFIDNYTLLVDNTYEKKIEDVEYIPFECVEINITYMIVDIPESNNKFILEFVNRRMVDFYFKTKNKITENDIFLNNDVSLILKTLNV